MADFNPALPIQLKWSVNEIRFDDNGKNPLALSIFIPAESAFALAQLIMDSAEDSAKTKTAKVWDYTKNEEVEVQGFYINGKANKAVMATASVLAISTPQRLLHSLRATQLRIFSNGIYYSVYALPLCLW